MNFNLNYEGFENYMVKERDDNYWGGYKQYQFRFDNNYGASVVKGFGTYGYSDDLWELAVLYWHLNDDGSWDYDLTYDTVITDDVIGHLTDQDVRQYLQQIKDL